MASCCIWDTWLHGPSASTGKARPVTDAERLEAMPVGEPSSLSSRQNP